MPKEGPNLKALARLSYVIPFLILQGIVFLALTVGIGEGVGFSDWKSWVKDSESIYKSALFGAAAPLIALVAAGVFSPLWKARLVHWRWRHPLPGSRAFTKHAVNDPRIDMAVLRQRVGFDEDPVSQNNVWYRLLKQHSSDTKVQAAHRDYLAMRDISVIALELAVVLPLLAGFALAWEIWLIWYVVGEFGVYVVSAIVAQNYGARLVTTVLACVVTES